MRRLKPPSPATLKKYGMEEKDWYSLLKKQGGKCPICQREFTEEMRPVVDHFHARGYKKMKPEQKAKYVRGLLCSYDNLRRVGKAINNSAIAYNIYVYLASFEERNEQNK